MEGGKVYPAGHSHDSTTNSGTVLQSLPESSTEAANAKNQASGSLVELFRREMMRRFSDKLSMEEIADFAYAADAAVEKWALSGSVPEVFVEALVKVRPTDEPEWVGVKLPGSGSPVKVRDGLHLRLQAPPIELPPVEVKALEAAAIPKLEVFLYILLRDHLPFGKVESILFEHVEKTAGMAARFSEPQMGKYAASLAARLR